MNNETDPPPDAPSDARSPLLVLVVDDDEMVRWSNARILRRAGYDTLEASGVEEALICMQEHGERVSVVLSDVIMPKQSGYDLGRIVRANWPATKVILISGYTPVAMDRHGIETDGFPLIQKPAPNLAEIMAQMVGPPLGG